MVSSRGPRPRSAWGDPVGCGPVCAEAEHDRAGAKQRNPSVRRTGRREAGTLLLRAGTECENERDNRAVDTLQLPFNDPNLDKEATTNGPEAQNEGQDIRKER